MLAVAKAMLIRALAAVWTLLPVITSLSRAFIAGLVTTASATSARSRLSAPGR